MLLNRQATEDRDEHIDMTPMVDVVFQLMTFMLFASQMTTGEPVEVPQARHGVGVDERETTLLVLLKPRAPGADPKLLVSDDKGKRKPATLDAARAAVAEGRKKGRRKVVLQADGAVPHGEVLKVAGALSEIEGITLHIGVQEAGR